MTNAAQDLNEMMQAWDNIEAAARAQYPNATAEQIYQLTRGAMNHAMGLE